MNSDHVKAVLEACHTNVSEVGVSYFSRLVLPPLFFIPLFFFGFTVGHFIACFIGFKLANRIIEHAWSGAFAGAYAVRHLNLRSKRKN